MLTPKKIIILLTISLILNSCTKIESNNQIDVYKKNNINNKASNHSNAKIITPAPTIDSKLYFRLIENPMRDVVLYSNSGSSFSSLMVGGGGWPPPVTSCGGITVTGTFVTTPPSGWCGTDVPPTYVPGEKDPWNNDIWFTGKYGTDPRQMYYVYYPINKSSTSPIVVLVHGGAWISGPDPTKVDGWGSTYTATNRPNGNLVKSLLNEGYVVVSLLYRLVQYGDNDPDIFANNITIQNQINDVDAAVTHIRNNFPSCLKLNANSIQVLGESAGANLALNFAYTKSDVSYVKSVISVSGPTNMNQFANFLRNKPILYNCFSKFDFRNPVLNPTTNPVLTSNTHFPYYMTYDPNDNNTSNTITALVNSLQCNIGDINYADLLTVSVILNLNKRKMDMYNLAQSCVGAQQIINNPISNILFTNISPCAQLNVSRIVPTFIIHGNNDWLVPYTQATNTMRQQLINIGGLINDFVSDGNSNIPTTYPTTGPKHIIKLYNDDGYRTGVAALDAFSQGHSNHDVSDNSQTQGDIIKWLNGHK